MIRYTITTWDSGTAMKARAFVAKRQAPAASRALYQAIWDMLDGDGARDTERGWRLVKQYDDCEISPPAHGYIRHERFYLRESDKMGAHVEFYAERI